MLLMAQAALLLLSTLSSNGVTEPFPAVRVEDEALTYTVDASSARGINEQLRDYARGAEHAEQGHTRGHFEVRSALDAKKSGQCGLASLEVSVHVSTTLPRWTAPAVAPVALEQRWNEARDRLQRHEAGHRANAVAGARALRDALLALPPQRSCMRLQMLLDMQAQNFIAQTAQRDDQYDRRTRHGLRDDPRLDQPPRSLATGAVAGLFTGDNQRRRGYRSRMDATASLRVR